MVLLVQREFRTWGIKHSDVENIIVSSMYTWHIGSTWYTPDLDVVATDISIFPTFAGFIYRRVKNLCTMFAQELTACLTSASVANRLPAGCFLRSSKSWESLGTKCDCRVVGP